MIVGNPQSRGVMLSAHNAYRQHGVSVQGMLPSFQACRHVTDLVRDVFWRDALIEWCGVEQHTAYWTVADLARASR